MNSFILEAPNQTGKTAGSNRKESTPFQKLLPFRIFRGISQVYISKKKSGDLKASPVDNRATRKVYPSHSVRRQISGLYAGMCLFPCKLLHWLGDAHFFVPLFAPGKHSLGEGKPFLEMTRRKEGLKSVAVIEMDLIVW